MKKLTLSVGLVVAILTAKPQDTTKIMISETKVYYCGNGKPTPYLHLTDNDKIIINVKFNEVLRLHLCDGELKTRKVFSIYSNGDSIINILNSKNNVYVSPIGPFRLEVDKSKFIQKL